MPLGDLADVNLHLPDDKAQAIDEEVESLYIDVGRLIRGRLAEVVPIAILTSWDTPATTPEIIREIAGKLVAAKFYANLVAEDEADGSEFAQSLYDQAIALLEGIINGTVTIIGIDEVPIELDTTSDFNGFPDATAPEPSFVVGQVWS